MGKRHLSLTAKVIITLILFILTPMIISVWLTSARLSSIIDDHINLRMYEGAKVAIKELHQYEENIRQAARALRDDIRITDAFIHKSWVESSLADTLDSYLKISKADFIRMYDDAGNQVLSTDNSLIGLSRKYHARIIQDALSGKVSTGFEDNEHDLELISVIPVTDRGYVHGVIVAGYVIDQDFLNVLRNISSLDISLYLNFSCILTTLNHDETKSLLHLPLPSRAVQSLREFMPFTNRDTYRDHMYQCEYYPLLGIDGALSAALGVTMEVDGFLWANKKTIYSLMGVGAVLIVCASAFGFFITRKVMQPLQELVAVGRQIKAGDLSGFDGHINGDEVGELASSFNYMIDDLKSAFTDLEVANASVTNAHHDTIFRLAIAAEFKDLATANHIKRISEYSAIIAEAYGLPKEEVELIKYAAPMHDIGKIGIPDDILLKDGKLTDDEYDRMKQHTMYGSKIFKEAETPLLQAAEIISLTHHEWYDGSGYPKGLKGDDIHLYGRIVAVADVFDALASERVYKTAFPLEDVLKIMREKRGTHFDPKVLDAFFHVLDSILEIKYSFGQAAK